MMIMSIKKIKMILNQECKINKRIHSLLIFVNGFVKNILGDKMLYFRNELDKDKYSTYQLNTTGKSLKVIINILKIILLVIIILVIVGVSTIFLKESFSVQPVSAIKSMECVIDGDDYSYEVVMNNDTSYILDDFITNDKEIDIDISEYINVDDVFKDIRKNVISRGGVCR